MAKHEVHTISKIEIDLLFDLYSYTVEQNKKQSLLILYGDNGCGKTTLLNCVFHLLSPEPWGRHRSYLGNVIFKELSVTFTNNFIVKAYRKSASNGQYKISCFSGKERILDWEWFPKKDEGNKKNEEIYQQYCKLMESLALHIHYLPANRKTEIEENDQEKIFLQKYLLDQRNMGKNSIRYKSESTDISLENIVENFKQWIRKQIIVLTNDGYRNINDLYYDLIKGLVSPRKSETILSSKDKIIKRVQSLESRNNEYQKFGLSDEIVNKDIMKILSSTSEEKIISISSIIIPYIESMELRLNSLERLQLLLNKLQRYLNQFFSDKHVIIDIENGVRIYNKKEIILDLQYLSSGEKQLLLLMCSVITAERVSNLVIIDEPEISLNVKWQRMFIEALLDLVNSNNCQIIIATHSIEMITKHQESVSILRDKNA